MRAIVLVVLASCWRGDPPPAPPAPEVVASPPCTKTTFDVANPRCLDVCAGDSPDDWPGCARVLHGSGAVPLPYAPGRLVLARIATYEALPTGAIAVTVVAGAREGVTSSWSGYLADRNGRIVPYGAVTVVRVTARSAVGETLATRATIRANPYVLLHP